MNYGAIACNIDDNFLDAACESGDFRSFMAGGPLDAPERMPAGSMRWGGITVREPCFPYRLRDTNVRAMTKVDR